MIDAGRHVIEQERTRVVRWRPLPRPSRGARWAVASYVSGAVYVFAHLLPRMSSHRLAWAANDQTVFEWMYAHTAYAIVHGANPFITHAMNAPAGVNLLANTSMLAIGALFTPVTLLFGAPVTFVLAQTACLAASASSWFWLWRRHVVTSTVAAWVGGAFCGFAPAIVAQANGHTNVTAQVLLPALVWGSLRLGHSLRPARDGAALGALVVLQYFVGPELLFDTVVGLALFVLLYAAQDRSVRTLWRPMARGLAAAGGVALAVLAYPISLQLAGPQSYRGIFVAPWRGTDLTKLVTFSADSLAGDRTKALRYVINPVEQNANYGWPLVILLALALVALWRVRLVRTALVCAVLVVWCSLGRTAAFRFHDTGVRTPWRWLNELPLFDNMLPGRMALIAVPFIGLVLAVAVDRALRGWRAAPAGRRLVPALALMGVVAALLPLLPTPLQVTARPSTPQFIADGTWRRYVAPGRGLIFAPPADPQHTEPMVWQSQALMGFTMPGGYFLAPVGPERLGKWPADARPTSTLLFAVAYHEPAETITDDDRVAAAADLVAWRADAVVLVDDQVRHAQLFEALSALFGRAQRVDDVWLWDVRASPADQGMCEDALCRWSSG